MVKQKTKQGEKVSTKDPKANMICVPTKAVTSHQLTPSDSSSQSLSSERSSQSSSLMRSSRRLSLIDRIDDIKLQRSKVRSEDMRPSSVNNFVSTNAYVSPANTALPLGENTCTQSSKSPKMELMDVWMQVLSTYIEDDHQGLTMPSEVALLVLYNVNLMSISACIHLLRIIEGRCLNTVITRSPLLHYCSFQIGLTCREIRRSIERQTTTSFLISDLFQNLICLHSRTLHCNSFNDAYEYAVLLPPVFSSVIEVANILEKLCGRPVTEWGHIAQEIVARTKDLLRDFVSVSVTSYVPKLSDFCEAHLVGCGRYGNVYRLKYKPLNVTLIMKVVPLTKFIDDGAVRSCFVDQSFASICEDPFIIRTLCCFTANPHCYINIMECFIQRYDLRRILNIAKYIDCDFNCILMTQVFLAIEILHMHGIIHRDICPDNVLVDRLGHVKVCDLDRSEFCCSHLSTDNIIPSYFERTVFELHNAKVIGSLMYASPEILNRRRYGRAVDLWALGVLVYRAATGTCPFRSNDERSLRYQILYEDVRWPRASAEFAPPIVRSFVFDLLRKNPRRRLGCTSYSDIYSAPFISRLNILIRELEPSVENPLSLAEKLNSTAELVPMDCIFRMIPNLTHDPPSYKSFLPITSVTEASFDQQLKMSLLTFVAAKYRQAIDAKKVSNNIYDVQRNIIIPAKQVTTCQSYYESLSPRQVLKEEDSIELVDIQRCNHTKLVTIDVPIRYQFGFKAIHGIQVEIVKGDGMVYPMVVATPNDKLLFIGDIIKSVNGVDVNTPNLSKEFFSKACTNLPRGASLVSLQVYEYSVFRLFSTNHTFLLNAFKNAVAVTLSVSCKLKSTCLLRTTKIRFSTAGVVQDYHVVRYIHNQFHTQGCNIYVGDVLLSVKNKPCANLTSAAVAFKFQNIKTPITVTILQFSILRRQDLLDDVVP